MSGQLGKRARARVVSDWLDRLVPDPAIPLDHKDPFTLLVATVLSAQCTDVRVNQVTPQLWAKLGDTPEALAQVDAEAIREIIRP